MRNYKEAKWHNGGISEVVNMDNKTIDRFGMNYNLTNSEMQFIDQCFVRFTNLQYKN